MSRTAEHFDTKLIHGAAQVPGDASKALCDPIHVSSTFTFDSIADAQKVMAFESDDYVYTRGNNPTLRLFERRMALLEGGADAVAFASGMAAISSTILSFCQPGELLFLHRTLYGSSHTLLTQLLPKYGIRSIVVDFTDLEALSEAIGSHEPTLLFCESPANPDLAIIDLEACSLLAHAAGASLVVDNTFATPYLQQPLSLGADAVVHSATKYICGHGDAVGGIAITRDEQRALSIKFEYMCELGGVLSPFSAFLFLRGLKTLSVRMERHCRNAREVARFLEGHSKVAEVYYPGLESDRFHELATRQMTDYGAVISFEVSGGLEAATRCIDACRLARIAVSLGDCETLIQLPAAMTHAGYDKAHLAEHGLTESMLRISVGIEDSQDIIEDLRQALDKV